MPSMNWYLIDMFIGSMCLHEMNVLEDSKIRTADQFEDILEITLNER